MKKIREEDIKKAVEIWKKENPNKKYLDILNRTIIEVEGIGTINIGSKITTIRQIYKAMQEGKNFGNLTEEEINYWNSVGMIWDYDSWMEENYQKAVEIWKKENSNKKYLDIPATAVIEVEGIGSVRIGRKIHIIRQIYRAMQEGKHYATRKDLTKEEVEYWNSQGMIWDYDEWRKENYQKAVEIWKKENPNQKYLDIPKTVVIELEGIGPINIGNKINNIRQIYRTMQEGKHFGSCEDLTEEEVEYWNSQGMIWDYDEWRKENYQKAVEIWKKENPNQKYLDIPATAVIELEGIGPINIGNKINSIRQIYRAMQEGKHFATRKDLTKEEVEYWNSQGMIWNYEEYGKGEKGNSTRKQSSTIKKYTDIFDGDKKKAERVVKCLHDLKERRKQRKKEEYSIDNILEEFDVNIEKLENILSKTRTSSKSDKKVLLTYQGMTLKEFCIKNSYNYDVIYHAICLHRFCDYDTLEQLINRSITTYQEKGQKKPATWIYEKYGALVKHILLYLKLDSNHILKEMSHYTISLEEAIRHEVFRLNRKEKTNDWLEEIYNYLIEEVDVNKKEEEIIQDITTKYQQLMIAYQLTREEHEIILTCFDTYLKTMKQYQIVDVGLETDDNRRIEKIRDYNLDSYDIEESFFIPLAFNQNVLLGRKSELYQRRQLLRQYIIDWDYYTEEEKEQIKIENHFTEEELKLIETTRRVINSSIKKVR